MEHKIISHYQPSDSLTQYGDGVFETMLGVGGDIHHWQYHWARLKNSCERLEITVPEHDALYADIQAQLRSENSPFSVIKMIVSRGEGLRGYHSHEIQPCFVHFNIAPYGANPAIYQGLNVRMCTMRLSSQPLLAGVKHCNRLEYVMARREADDSVFDEGLLFDYDGNLIEGLISNVFLVTGQRITTPILENAGVCGTMRQYLLDTLPEKGYDIEIKQLSARDLETADAVFLTNATNGITAVASIDGFEKKYCMHTVKTIQQCVYHPRHPLGQ